MTCRGDDIIFPKDTSFSRHFTLRGVAGSHCAERLRGAEPQVEGGIKKVVLVVSEMDHSGSQRETSI